MRVSNHEAPHLCIRAFILRDARSALLRMRISNGNSFTSIFILHCGKKLAHSELPGNF